VTTKPLDALAKFTVKSANRTKSGQQKRGKRVFQIVHQGLSGGGDRHVQDTFQGRPKLKKNVTNHLTKPKGAGFLRNHKPRIVGIRITFSQTAEGSGQVQCPFKEPSQPKKQGWELYGKTGTGGTSPRPPKPHSTPSVWGPH